MIGLTGIDALEAEMRDRLADKDATIRDLQAKIQDLSNIIDDLHMHAIEDLGGNKGWTSVPSVEWVSALHTFFPVPPPPVQVAGRTIAAHTASAPGALVAISAATPLAQPWTAGQNLNARDAAARGLPGKAAANTCAKTSRRSPLMANDEGTAVVGNCLHCGKQLVGPISEWDGDDGEVVGLHAHCEGSYHDAKVRAEARRLALMEGAEIAEKLELPDAATPATCAYHIAAALRSAAEEGK